MTGIVCAIVGNSVVTAVAEVIRRKVGITAVGNAQISAAQYKFGYTSALFDGSNDSLQGTLTTSIGTGEFTWECWLRFTDTDGGGIIDLGNVTLYLRSDEKLGFYDGNTATEPIPAGSTTLSTNTWYHIAATRQSSDNKIRIYLNGTLDGTSANAYTTSIETSFKIGETVSNIDLLGHIDEVRISNTARYTANFTPSTTPFVNDNNTLLLLHCDGTAASTFFEDDNGVRGLKGLTANNQAQIDTAQSKFGGSSALFDGTGDYIISSASSDLQFTGNFTIEMWVRLASTGAIRVPLGNRGGSPGAGIWWIELGTDQAMYSALQNTAGTSYYPVMSGTLATNTWYHIAVVRNGSNLTFYKDGVGGTAITSVTGTFGLTDTGIYIGGIATSFGWNGHLDEIRISNTARYTANFTPPTTPFVNDANTVLLLHMDGTDGSTVFRDDNGTGRSPRGNIVPVNQAQIDTSQSKFGGSSLRIDGTDDSLQITDSSLKPGNFTNYTLEFWFKSSSGSATEMLVFQGVNTGGAMDYWQLYVTSTNILFNTPGNSQLSAAVTRDTNWHHVALVKQGSTSRVYYDGVSAGSFTLTDANWNATDNDIFYFGIQQGNTTDFNGWFDEVRISSVARYPDGTTFTPSTTAFSNDSNTLLLLHMDGTNGSTVFFDDNGQVPQTP